MILVISQNLS